MSEVSVDEGWLSLPDAAESLRMSVNRVRQLLRDGALAGELRSDGEFRIPASFVVDGEIVKGLSGVLTVLSDAGYTTGEALRWLHTPDDSLPGTPVEALRSNRGREVKRRAQASAF